MRLQLSRFFFYYLLLPLLIFTVTKIGCDLVRLCAESNLKEMFAQLEWNRKIDIFYTYYTYCIYLLYYGVLHFHKVLLACKRSEAERKKQRDRERNRDR